jgi:galactokinase/mevalonate kinase-like predicted kinase
MPVPNVVAGETGPLDQVLADLQLPPFCETLQQAGTKAAVLIASGDVWLDFNAADIPAIQHDFTGIGMQVPPETAQHFGVFFVRRRSGPGLQASEKIAFFLQKPSVAEIRKLARDHEYYVDTGLWLLSASAVEFLFRQCGWNNQEGRFEDDSPLPLDLYSEIGPALGTDAVVPERLKKAGFGSLTSGLVALENARFFHLGSSRQLLESFEEMQPAGSTAKRSFFVAADSQKFRVPSRTPAWVEGVETADAKTLGGFNVVTGIPLAAAISHLAENACIDVAPSGKNEYIVRPYHIDDACRGLPHAGGRICGFPGATWLKARGFPVTEEDVFSLRIYPLVKAEQITQRLVDWFFAEQPDEEMNEIVSRLPKTSAREMPSLVNFTRYFAQRTRARASALKARFEQLITQESLDVLSQDCAAMALFCREHAPELVDWIKFRAKEIGRVLEAHPEQHARFLMLLSELDEGSSREGLTHAGFRQLQGAMLDSRQLAKVYPQRRLKEDQIVWARSPVRLDLAGGWTDTPPFCLQAGGSVLNVAVLLNGQPPIQVFLRPTADFSIKLRSIDLGSEETIATHEDLADYRNPRGNFSLPKAALALAGFSPEFLEGRRFSSLRAHLKALGGGMELSLLSAVPKGSGLGTSSILGATLLGALNRACGLGWDDIAIYNRVMGMEQLLTTGGGWQDQAGAIFPGLKLIETRPGITQIPTVRYLPIGLFGPDVVNRELLLYYTGATRLAKGILQEIVRDMFLGQTSTLHTLEAIRGNAHRLYQDLQRGDTSGLQRCIARSWRLNKQLDPGTTTPEIEKIIKASGDDLAACKLLGAGGGGYMLMCAKDAAAGQRIRERLETTPPNSRARFIDFSVSPVGLQVSVS